MQRPKHLLLIEDDGPTATYLERLFRHAGYRVTVHDCAEDALGEIQTRDESGDSQFSAVLSDHHVIGDMTGGELYWHLFDEGHPLHCRFAMYSGSESNWGCPTLRKPARSEEILAIVHEVLTYDAEQPDAEQLETAGGAA